MAACYANGIVSGYNTYTYGSGDSVTAVQAASMMMRALGYFRYQNDYADGFMVSTVRQGTKIGIFEGVGTDGSTPMTRNQVAQMALNALKSGMVEPDGNTINLTTPDGTVFTGKVNYVFVTSAKPYATAISSVQATAVGSQNGGTIVAGEPWRIPWGHSLDISASYRFNIGGLDATVFGNVNNLYDYNYVTQAYCPVSAIGTWENAYQVFYSFGRTYSLRLRVNF